MEIKNNKTEAIFYHTKNSKSTIKVKKNMVVIKSSNPTSYISVDACLMFDLLKDSLKIRSKNPGISRRAKQLNGHSLLSILRGEI